MLVNPKQRLFLFVCVGLVIITLAAYRSVGNHGFILFDDDEYVIKNPPVRTGLTWQNIQWAFTTTRAANRHPLTWLSLMLDCTLFGVKPGPMHLVNVTFHAANTLLLFIIFNRMTKYLWPSAFIAALFALHPLHVESVAWIAERKDVLSTFFWFLTMLAYIRFIERPSAGGYVITLVVFALGLMSKPMLVTLPFALILLDYWPLNRFLNSKFSILNSLSEKLPLIFLSAIFSVITFTAQKGEGAVHTMVELSLGNSLANASRSYLAYIGKMFLPVRLSVFYAYPAAGVPVLTVVSYAAILIFITAVCIYFGRRLRYLPVGWFWYMGTLIPVIGIVQVGTQAMADRYTYIPLIGLFIIVAFAADDIIRRIPSIKPFFAVLGSVILLSLAILTSRYLKLWQNSYLLFNHSLTISADSCVMQNNFGNALREIGKIEESALHYKKAIEVYPDYFFAHSNLGQSLEDLNRPAEAAAQYKTALRLDPNAGIVRVKLVRALSASGDYNAAIEQYKILLGPNANAAEMHRNFAGLLIQQGKLDEAILHFKKALEFEPGSVETLNILGYALAMSDKPAQAIEYYRKALQLDPDNTLIHGRLALAFASAGMADEAIEQCRIVLAANPNDVEMHNNIGILLQAKGRLSEAAQSFKNALQIDPNFQPARENLDALVRKQQQN